MEQHKLFAALMGIEFVTADTAAPVAPPRKTTITLDETAGPEGSHALLFEALADATPVAKGSHAKLAAALAG